VSPPRRLVADGPDRWRIDPTGAMRVPGVVYASQSLLPQVAEEEALEQVANVATLPGIVVASFAMPDVHWGYGFPIGGVAATDVGREGVVSPGGVGFDISCGVRLLVSPLDATELAPHLGAVMDELDARVPTGLGAGGVWSLNGEAELTAILRHGAPRAVAAGFGTEADLARCAVGEVGVEADAGAVEDRARARGGARWAASGRGTTSLRCRWSMQCWTRPPQRPSACGGDRCA
jgi:tRNA-splicing ligase RtcB